MWASSSARAVTTRSVEPPATSPASRPSRRKTTRLAVAAAAGSWLTMTSVCPSLSFSSRNSRSTSPLERVSRLPVGSSASTISGSVSSARAIETRCCSPPESSAGRWSARSASPTRPSSSLRPPAHLLVAPPRDQRGQQHVLLGGQRGQQVEELEDEADLLPAQPGELAVAEPVVALAGEQDLARAGGVERAQQVQEGALPRARGAHDRGHLAALDLEADAVEGADGGLPLPVDLGQLARLERRRTVHAPRLADRRPRTTPGCRARP